MNRVLKLVGIFILIISPTFVGAQSSGSWINYKELDAVKIDYTVQQCGQEPNVITEFCFIRLTNKTDNPVSIKFRVEYYYNGSCTTCNDDKYIYSFNLPAHESIVPDCSLSSPASALAIIKKYVNRNFGYPLDRFELSNIIVQ